MSMVNKPFTPEEQEIMDLLVKAWELFTKLPKSHPCHKRDFSDGVHKCQDVLIHKVVQRDYPNTFPTHIDIK